MLFLHCRLLPAVFTCHTCRPACYTLAPAITAGHERNPRRQGGVFIRLSHLAQASTNIDLFMSFTAVIDKTNMKKQRIVYHTAPRHEEDGLRNPSYRRLYRFSKHPRHYKQSRGKGSSRSRRHSPFTFAFPSSNDNTCNCSDPGKIDILSVSSEKA